PFPSFSNHSATIFIYTLSLHDALPIFFDSFAFNLIVKHNEPDFEASLIGHIIGKSFAAFAYSLILYIYLKYVDGESENVSFISKDRKSTRLNSSHVKISYAVFCLKKKK